MAILAYIWLPGDFPPIRICIDGIALSVCYWATVAWWR